MMGVLGYERVVGDNLLHAGVAEELEGAGARVAQVVQVFVRGG